MYLVPLKTAIVEALRATFDVDYPQADFQKIQIGIEYPATQTEYPGLWVNYEDTDEVQIAGIGHKEFIAKTGNVYSEVTRWKFAGQISITCVAMTSLERDRLYDEVVRTFAFGRENQALSQFRDKIESNDFIAMNINFDSFQPNGDNQTQGTPWNTDEYIYEKTLSMEVIGEFVGDPSTMDLVKLSAIVVEGTPLPNQTSPWPESSVGTGGWQ